MVDRPVVVQHSFGELGSGGPIGALARVMASPLAQKYEFVPMHQATASGGIDATRLREWRKMLREVRPDLVHVRGLANEGLHGVLAARAAGCPRILVSVHGTVRDLSRKRVQDWALAKAAEPLTLRLATHVTTVCHYAAERDFVKRHAKKFVGPIVNGVDVPDLSSTRETVRAGIGVNPDATMLIMVGRTTWEKGHEYLAQAISTMPLRVQRSVSLVLVGDGPDREAIVERYSQSSAQIVSLGRRSDVNDLLGAADMFVFPSLHENLSNALIEAMASGLPVIATAVGGNTEVVQRGGGILVPAADTVSLRNALEELISTPPARTRLGAEARRVAVDNYSVAAMCEALDGIYSKILESGPR